MGDFTVAGQYLDPQAVSPGQRTGKTDIQGALENGWMDTDLFPCQVSRIRQVAHKNSPPFFTLYG